MREQRRKLVLCGRLVQVVQSIRKEKFVPFIVPSRFVLVLALRLAKKRLWKGRRTKRVKRNLM